MKKISFLTFVLLLIVSCGGDDDPRNGGGNQSTGGSEYLNVNNGSSNLDISSNSTQVTLRIDASQGCEWRITWDEGQTWIRSINPSSGRGSKDVIITVNENTTLKENSTLLTISNTNGNITPRTITLRQLASGAILTLNVENNRLTFPSTGGEQKVSVSSNTSWNIEGIPSWLTVTPKSGEANGVVTISASPNTTKDEQSTVLVFRPTGGTPVQLSITQAVASLPIVQRPQVTNITTNGATVTFSFNSELPVTAYGVSYSTTDDDNLDSHPYIAETWSANQGNPSVNLTGLSAGTIYYVHAYAISAVGRQYSEKEVFSTARNWPSTDDNQRPE